MTRMSHSLFNRYTDLFDKSFYSFETAAKFQNPEIILYNKKLSEYLNFNFTKLDLKKFLSGKANLDSKITSISFAYAGHQFGHFVPKLGDGRALLLGQVQGYDNKFYDLQLKGSGPTHFSRGGDGYSALGPTIREYVVSEAMYFLGIPTTRTLSVVKSGETVFRQEGEVFGGISSRLASSHIRIGTLEYFLNLQDYNCLHQIINFVIERHYPHLLEDKTSDKFYKLFSEICDRLCYLVSKWMSVGFIHGVMNTDNMLLSGETIDYGPCAFMDNFNFNQVFSFIDKKGRYAYGNQPQILFWNLSRLADCFIPLCDGKSEEIIEKLNEIIKSKTVFFEKLWYTENLKKFGLLDFEQKKDNKITNTVSDFSFVNQIEKLDINEVTDLISSWFTFLQKNKLDFTESFREIVINFYQNTKKYNEDELYTQFFQLHRNFTREFNLSADVVKENVLKNNPVYIPRNHLVENVIKQAYEGSYPDLFELLEVIESPFIDRQKFSKFALPPTEHEKIKNTFCGT